MTELRAVRQKMATGPMQAAENEKQKIIFKWALKIQLPDGYIFIVAAVQPDRHRCV